LFSSKFDRYLVNSSLSSFGYGTIAIGPMSFEYASNDLWQDEDMLSSTSP